MQGGTLLGCGIGVLVAAGALACGSFGSEATPDPTPVSDGSAPLEASKDAAPDDSRDATPGPLPLVATFGERPSATVQGVTTDTELHEAPLEQTLNYGKADLINVDSDVGASKVVLLRFELSAVPTTRVVNKATLKLWTHGDSGCEASGGDTVPVFRVLESWDQGSADGRGAPDRANYLERKLNAAWKAPGAAGASRSATPEGSFSPDQVATEFEVELTSLVKVWTSNPGLNFGMALTIAAPVPGDGVCFVSSEATIAERRPLLTITFVE